MTTRMRIFAVFVLLSVGGVGSFVLLRPRFMKWQTHRALEQAASDFCFCMMGKHGDVRAGISRVRAALVTNNPKENPWPDRCETLGFVAGERYEDAWHWDDIP